LQSARFARIRAISRIQDRKLTWDGRYAQEDQLCRLAFISLISLKPPYQPTLIFLPTRARPRRSLGAERRKSIIAGETAFPPRPSPRAPPNLTQCKLNFLMALCSATCVAVGISPASHIWYEACLCCDPISDGYFYCSRRGISHGGPDDRRGAGVKASAEWLA